MALGIDVLARVTYDVDRAYREIIDDPDTQPAWENAEPWRKLLWKRSCQVFLHVAPGNPSDWHEFWRQEMESGGWSFGPVIDFAAKEHPFIVPFMSLTDAQKKQENLFTHAMFAFKDGWTQATVDALIAE